MTLQMKVFISFLYFFSFCFTLFSEKAFAQDSNQSLQVNIGCLYPLTGPAGLYGRDSVVAIKMAQDFIKQSQRFSNLDVRVKIGDTRSKS